MRSGARPAPAASPHLAVALGAEPLAAGPPRVKWEPNFYGNQESTASLVQETGGALQQCRAWSCGAPGIPAAALNGIS